MSLPKSSDWIIPEETIRVARAAFPKGGSVIRIRDALGVLYDDQDWAALFATRGQPAESPGRLLLVLQFLDGFTDRQAADAVRGRIDWKYALGLDRCALRPAAHDVSCGIAFLSPRRLQYNLSDTDRLTSVPSRDQHCPRGPLSSGQEDRMTLQQFSISLDDVVVNAELARRPSRTPDYPAEHAALLALAHTMAEAPQTILQHLADTALRLCRADTAGISLLETHDGAEVFRWEALAGVYADRLNTTMPRNASPCGTTIDRNAPQLMYMAERFFPALTAIPPVVEALLLPFYIEGKPTGTVWVVAHDERRKFDREDARLVQTLAQFAAAAWRVWQAQADLERRVAERTAALRQEMAERQRLERAAHRAEHFAMLGRMAAGVSHEIRNPLGAIFLHMDVLEEELRQPSPESAAEVTQALSEIRTQLARLNALVQDYLSLARVGTMEQTPQEIGAMVRAWAQEWQPLAAPRAVTLHLEGLADLGQAAVHESTCRRALLNLVQNALDAMPHGGTLTVAGLGTATHVQLQVRDTGDGIPAECLATIFEPLYTTKSGGTGLGLYIVQEIVKAHGGDVTVASGEGQGTLFTLTLPR